MTVSWRTDLPRKDCGRGNFSMSAFFVFFMTFVSNQQWWKFSLIPSLWLTYLSKSFLQPFTFLVIFNSGWALALTQSLHAEAMSLQSACILVPASALRPLLLCLSSVRSFHPSQPHLLPSLLDLLHIEMDFFSFFHTFRRLSLSINQLGWDFCYFGTVSGSILPTCPLNKQKSACLNSKVRGSWCHLQTEIRQMCLPARRSGVSTEGSIQTGPMDRGQFCKIQ